MRVLRGCSMFLMPFFFLFYSCSKENDEGVGNRIHEAVDLGLDVKWANCNIGANVPEQYGGLYGWGDPTGLLTSRIFSDYIGLDPPQDICGSDYDIAHIQWGEGWRLPSFEEILELKEKCSWTWISKTFNNKIIYGMKVTGPNGNYIFLPAAGVRGGDDYYSLEDVYGFYWCGKLYENSNKHAWFLGFTSSGASLGFGNYYRYVGSSIRPVTE
jgi:hypothetical protein